MDGAVRKGALLSNLATPLPSKAIHILTALTHASYLGARNVLNALPGDKIASAHSRKRYEVLELGVNSPGPLPTGVLRKGQVGWIVVSSFPLCLCVRSSTSPRSLISPAQNFSSAFCFPVQYESVRLLT